MSAGAETLGWGRRRLLVVAIATVLAVVGGAVGLVYAVHGALTAEAPGAAEATAVATTGSAHRDAIAAAPMLAVDPGDSRGGTPAANPAPTIAVPAATDLGPEDVPTGFARTEEGAVGQLAAITTTVLQTMSIERTRAVYAQWSAPDAPPVEYWALLAAVRAFLGSDAGPHVDEPGTSVITVPVAAQIKGTDGRDWVVACVLLDVTVTVVTEARAAYGHCERLAWSGDRWVVAAGTAPVEAPSTWPGTDLAAEAGWRTWTTTK